MDIHFEIEKQKVVELAKSHLEKSLREALAQSKKILFLVSGGSNIELLESMDQELLKNSNITIFPLDERHDRGGQNNSLMIGAAGIPIQVMMPQGGESVEAFGNHYHFFLENWIEKNQVGKIIALIGVGPDGHTAGISPGEQEWFERTFSQLNSDTWAVGYTGNLQPPQRVTVTPTFLIEKIAEGVIVATGAGKANALQKMLTDGDWGETPARILNSTKDKMTLYTDVKIG